MVPHIDTQYPTNIIELTGLDPDVHLPTQSNFNYFTTSEFRNDFQISSCISSKHFSVLHSNIRSLNANFENLMQMITELNHNFSIIGLTETKINSSNQNTRIHSIPGYNFFSQPSESNAGGVGFYISNKIPCFIRNDISGSQIEFECLWIEIQCDLNHNIVCGVVYRHPHSNIDQFIEYLNNTIEKLNNENKYCVIMGDFNIDLLNTSHPATDEFLNTLETRFFNPHILQPTRITDHSSTLIDNIFFNSITHHTISGNIVYDLTDHLPNFLIINKFTQLPKQFKITKRDYSGFNKEEFLNEIQSMDLTSELNNYSDPSDMFNIFYSKISNIVDKHAPVKQLSRKEIKQLSKPWITKGIKTSIDIKNKIYKQYIKNKSLYYYDKFKFYRNKLNRLIKVSKKNYYQNYFSTNRSNIKKTWKGIKEIIGFKNGNSSVPPKIVTSENRELTDCQSIANCFNNFFANVGENTANSVPATTSSASDFLPPKIVDTFVLSEITSEEIEKLIEKLNGKKATGPYSIPISLLKIMSGSISQILAKIFNASLTKGTVPECFKLASITPIFKKGSQLDVNNYRPISLLSTFNKILEKLVFTRLIKFINDNNILYEKQFGFRCKHSTTQAILAITDKIQCAIEEGVFSCGIFLDLSKAFDTVNHNILIQKLDHYGIRGNAKIWFQSYLENRCQYVSLGDVKSDIKQLNHGVPQGSVLGPLLFLLYINDLQNSSSVFEFHLFADDSNLFCKNKKLQELESTINNQLIFVNSWLCANKLSLNVDKSSFVIFHPPQKKMNYNLNININSENLKQETQIKYLGIMLDNNLNWKPHVSFISSKIKRNIGIICKARHYVNLDILRNLYYSLIYPYLTYGILSWGHTFQSTTSPLLILQKKVIRLMTFSAFQAHTQPLFFELQILKFPDLVFLYTALFMYDYHNDNLPISFKSYFTRVNQIHNYNTRLASKNSYALPKARTNYGKYNIKFSGVTVWNSINEYTKALSNQKFKDQLCNDIFSSYIS